VENSIQLLRDLCLCYKEKCHEDDVNDKALVTNIELLQIKLNTGINKDTDCLACRKIEIQMYLIESYVTTAFLPVKIDLTQ